MFSNGIPVWVKSCEFTTGTENDLASSFIQDQAARFSSSGRNAPLPLTQLFNEHLVCNPQNLSSS